MNKGRLRPELGNIRTGIGERFDSELCLSFEELSSTEDKLGSASWWVWSWVEDAAEIHI
jgi:hypothetical protein